MNLKVGDQLILRKGFPGEQIAQIRDIIDTSKFYNDSGETEYLVKTMKSGDVTYTESQIRELKNIQFYKAKEDREFDVMEKFESPFERAINNNRRVKNGIITD